MKNPLEFLWKKKPTYQVAVLEKDEQCTLLFDPCLMTKKHLETATVSGWRPPNGATYVRGYPMMYRRIKAPTSPIPVTFLNITLVDFRAYFNDTCWSIDLSQVRTPESFRDSFHHFLASIPSGEGLDLRLVEKPLTWKEVKIKAII